MHCFSKSQDLGFEAPMPLDLATEQFVSLVQQLDLLGTQLAVLLAELILLELKHDNASMNVDGALRCIILQEHNLKQEVVVGGLECFDFGNKFSLDISPGLKKCENEGSQW